MNSKTSWQTMDCSPNQDPCLFVLIKFNWNTATLISLHIVCGWSCTTVARLGIAKDSLGAKPKTFTLLTLCRRNLLTPKPGCRAIVLGPSFCCLLHSQPLYQCLVHSRHLITQFWKRMNEIKFLVCKFFNYAIIDILVVSDCK